MKRYHFTIKLTGMKIYLLLSLSALVIIFSSMINNPSPILVPYPEGYRKWTHIKSMIVAAKDSASDHARGYHHIYANEKAMQGYRTGRFPDGAIIVADFIEMVESEKFITEGKRKFIDVMQKNSLAFAQTDGWGYEEFDGDSKERRVLNEKNPPTACHSCHQSQKNSDYVFSKWRE